MIHLEPTIDDTLIARCASVPDAAALQQTLESLAQEQGVRDAEVFHVETDRPLAEEEIRGLRQASDYLLDRVGDAIQMMAPVFPQVDEDIHHKIRFVLIPRSSVCFGSQPGTQIFGVDPSAKPQEILLFLAHVCCHEVSSFGYTGRCQAVSNGPSSAEDALYWIKLLIRNEGIANYPVLSELTTLVQDEPGYECRYFTYAHWLDDDRYLRAAGYWLENQIKTQGDDDYSSLVASIKRSGVPSINLLGIAMSRAVVESDGVASLATLACEDPAAFFRRYEEIQAKQGQSSVVPDILQ